MKKDIMAVVFDRPGFNAQVENGRKLFSSELVLIV